MAERHEEVFNCECPKCEHQWTVSVKEWVRLSVTTGKTPRCPKCNSGRLLWQFERSDYYSQRASKHDFH